MNRRLGNSSPDRGHLATATILDFLEDRLTAAETRRVEDHLARPCPKCRESLRSLAALAGHLRADRTPEVPEWLHERARAVFRPAQAPPLRERVESFIAGLLFDSFRTPATAAARRSVGEARRLRYTLGETAALELELEREGAHTQTVRGRLASDDATLATVEITAGAERRVVAPDADGAFQVAGLPEGPLAIAVDSPDGRWTLPAVEPA